MQLSLTRLVGVLAILASLSLATGAATQAARSKMRVVFLVDSTAYMAAVFGDASKLAATRNALLSVLPVHSGKFDIGFLIYGHQVSGQESCSSLDRLSPVGPFDGDSVGSLFGSLKTKGDAPIASALRAVFADKQTIDGQTVVVLVAGGPESCHVDPCQAAGELAADHSIPVNIIAIDAGGEAEPLNSLKCIADNTKGGFWRVGSTMELAAALDDALAGVVKQSSLHAEAPVAAPGGSDKSSGIGSTNSEIAPAGSANRPADAGISLSALLTEAGAQLTSGLVWNVFVSPGGSKGPVKLVASSRDANPSFKLPSGDYLVNVAYGRAYITRSLKLAPGEQTAQLTINAGGLKVGAHLTDGSLPPSQLVNCDVYSDQRDQFGNRTRVLSGIRPGVIVRLNSGLYHIAATYGDANATVGVDVGVEAGKITDAVFTLTGAKVTFKLVQQAGGEALTGTSWTIAGAGGETIKHSLAALPTHILAAGNYTVVAERSGKKYSQDFVVKPAEPVLVEVQASADP